MDSLESLAGALTECIKAAGGTKRVAAMLWPAKAAQNLDAARRYLANCVNPDCAEKLGLDEIMLVLRAARDAGCHAGMQYMAHALSYAEPQPIEPRDEADELRRQVLAMGQQLQRALGRLDEIERRPALRSAA